MTGIQLQFGDFVFEKRFNRAGQPELYIYHRSAAPTGQHPFGPPCPPVLPSVDYLAGLVPTPGQTAKLARQLEDDSGIMSKGRGTFITVQNGFAYFDIATDGYSVTFRFPEAKLPDFIRAWEQHFEPDFPDRADLEWQVCHRKMTDGKTTVRFTATLFGPEGDAIQTRCGPVPAHLVAALYLHPAGWQPGEVLFLVEESSVADIVATVEAMERLIQTTLPPGVSAVTWHVGESRLTFDGQGVTIEGDDRWGRVPADQIENFATDSFRLMQDMGQTWQTLNS